ncbi:beta carbonic anhydrase 5, chloroplastic-like isoform X6 [Bidens hawaiensis]|uniref:beta carbonic anhydrase 5, chloroplastic-like isoform X6 n=1 Tax=Bidens hawaiensis TaxID=980011 RepID=UPI00404AD8BC
MKVVLRSVLLLPKQPFLRSVTVSILGSSPVHTPQFPRSSGSTSSILGSKLKFSEIEQTQLGSLSSSKENLECYKELAEAQAPKFLVISCADSRVCPSYILGFQPGEAFVVRNVANFVPPFENGPCETNAALEFSVNDLQVQNILVTGHSCCGGIRALMSMDDEEKSSSFIKNWVKVGKTAKSITKAIASNLSFDQQCKHCEKESINNSLLNLLTYPWVEERVAKGLLSLHGGYYDFVECTYEKWTLDYQKNSQKQETGGYAIKNREFWS